MSPPRRESDGRAKARPGVEEQRRNVLEAAIRLFSEHGSAAVSVSQICTAADVSRPTFYRCFANKEDLIEQLYRTAVSDHMHVNLASVLRAGSGPEVVRAALDAMADRIFENPEVASFLFAESGDERSAAHAIVRSAFDGAADRLERAFGKREIRGPSRTAMKATMVACQWIVHDAIRGGLTPQTRAAAKSAMWEVIRGVFAIREK